MSDDLDPKAANLLAVLREQRRRLQETQASLLDTAADAGGERFYEEDAIRAAYLKGQEHGCAAAALRLNRVIEHGRGVKRA